MKALDIMQALRDVPDDLIDECFASAQKAGQYASRTGAAPAVRMQQTIPQKKRAERPYAFSGIVAAACLLFAAGFGGVMLHESRKNQPVLSSGEQQAAVTEMDEESSAPLPEYVPLELHEPPRTGTHEEAEDVRIAGNQRFIENGSKPAVIDKQIYIDKYFSADSDTDYNDPEAKSYLYHMMLNSIDYYRTAEGTMNYAIPDGAIADTFQIDLKNGISYERQDSPGQNPCEIFLADDTEYIVYSETKTYMTRENPMLTNLQNDLIVSDNDRAWVDENGESFCITRPVSLSPGICSSCLFPQDYAMSVLGNFEKWQVTGTEIRLDRNCAVLAGSFQEVSFQLSTDVETGILLSYETFDPDGTRNGYFELTSLTVDAEIDVKRFDPDGYTCINEDDIYLAPEHTVKAPHATVDYEINENGQTYGTTPDSVYLEDYPDLISVIGNNGKQGYIYKEDYIGDLPDSPEEAEKIAEAQHNGTDEPRTFNVYASDGKTVIDTFTEKP